MLKARRGLSGLASVVVVAGLILLGTGVEASGAADPPTLSVSPNPATPGETVTFTGAGWEGCTASTVIAIAPGSIIAVVTAVDGSFLGTFPAPAVGMYRLSAAAGFGATCRATATLDVAESTATTTAPTTTTTTVPGATTTTLPGATTTTVPGATTTTVPGATTTTVPGATTTTEPATALVAPEAGTAPESSASLPVTG